MKRYDVILEETDALITKYHPEWYEREPLMITPSTVTDIYRVFDLDARKLLGWIDLKTGEVHENE